MRGARNWLPALTSFNCVKLHTVACKVKLQSTLSGFPIKMSDFDTLGTALRSALEEYNETKHRADDDRCYARAEYFAYQPEDFKPDADDRIYALRLNNTRFKVTRCSTVYFAGVYVP